MGTRLVFLYQFLLPPSPPPPPPTHTHTYMHIQRVHSTRSYKQALEVYKGRGWTLAEDYILFSLARHSFSLHRLLDAKIAFDDLLSHEGSHTPSQQLLHLKDYIFVHRVRKICSQRVWIIIAQCTRVTLLSLSVCCTSL